MKAVYMWYMMQNPRKSGKRRREDGACEPPFDLPECTGREVGRSAAPPPACPDSAVLSDLNPEQRRAAETLDGPLLVLAGAGTGKTRVLTARIVRILETRHAYPSQILAVTFTNKAAREMRDRVSALAGGLGEGMPWLGTFHAVSLKILRRHAELVERTADFTILDADDQIRLLKQVIEADGLDKDRWPARQLAALIDGWKNRGLTPDKVPAGEAYGFAAGRGADLYRAYQRRLVELNACDFGDLLLEGLRLLTGNPDLLADYRSRFRYLLVDEYQDTNAAQYLWLRLLAGEQPNLCCVGDDDQAIYGWRGAEVENILRFERDFPGAAVIRLERNYRSTGHILGAAAGLISRNAGRLGKTLFTDGEMGAKVALAGVWDDEEEARAVGEEIEDLWRKGHSLDGIAILVRASAQMRAFEDRFVALGLPYRVVGGPRFYERQEIRDAIAYFETVLNPANDLKFERIVNVPKRGVGETAVKRLRELARARGVPLFQAAREIVETEELSGKARKSLRDLVGQFLRWRGLADTLAHTELAEIVLDESGYTAMWQADKSPQAQGRLENLKELVRFMHGFETLAAFLEHVSLVMDADLADAGGGRVSLMTLHAAKGLEFDTVFLPGWEEGLFPHQRVLGEGGKSGLEEERRLAYVGLTRARRRARISFAENRRTRGFFQAALPSRFLSELPADHVELSVAPRRSGGGAFRSAGFGADHGAGGFGGGPGGQGRGFSEGAGSGYETPGWRRAREFASARRTGGASRPPLTIDGELAAAEEAGPAFSAGERVFHEKFGTGLVVEGGSQALTIDFDRAGRKRVMASFLSRRGGTPDT